MQVAVENNILINELQLGVKLGECIQSKRRSDFSLMLAMLCDDVREHSQFSLPIAQVPCEQDIEIQLRKDLQLPPKAPLSIKNIEELSQFNQAQNVVDGQLASIRLENSLNPKPISFYDDKKHIATDIMNNTTLYCQKKHSTSVTDLAQRLTFNVKGWLDGIESSIVKAPLIS